MVIKYDFYRSVENCLPQNKTKFNHNKTIFKNSFIQYPNKPIALDGVATYEEV